MCVVRKLPGIARNWELIKKSGNCIGQSDRMRFFINAAK